MDGGNINKAEIRKGMAFGAKSKDVQGDLAGLDTAGHQLLPLLMGLLDDAKSKVLALGLAMKGKCVLGLASRDLVDAEPLVGGRKLTGHELVNVIDV